MDVIRSWGPLAVSFVALFTAICAAPETPKPDLSAVLSEIAPLDERITALEAQATQLGRRLEYLESRPMVTVTGDGSGTAEAVTLAGELERLRAEVTQLRSGALLQTDTGRAQLAEAMRVVEGEQDQQRREQWATRQLQAQEQSKAAREQRWRAFASEIRLPSRDEYEMLRLFDEEASQRQAILEQMRAGTLSRRDGRAQLNQIRSRTDEAVVPLIGDEQRQKYRSLRRQEERDLRGNVRGAGLGDGRGLRPARAFDNRAP